jgi:tetratricopeptide (TPR) repeat protein
MVTPALFLLVAGALPGAAGLEARPGFGTPAARRAGRQASMVAGVLALSVVPYLAARGPVVAAPAVARWFGDAPRSSVALTMSRVLAEYWRILAFPSFLGGDFAYAARLPTLHAPTPGFWAGTAAWLAVLAAALGLWRRAPVAAVGLLWTFVGLLPVLQILPVGVLLAERLLYLPSVGFCLAAAAGLGALVEVARRKGLALGGRGAGALVGLLLLALGVRTAARTLDWVDAQAFWESELRKAPREVVVNNNLAVEYNRRGRYREAAERLRVALEVSPGYWRAHVNLGISLQRLGDGAGARRALLEAMRIAPQAMDPPAWLGRLAAEDGRLEEAVSFAARARRLAPEQALLAREQGAYLLRLGRVAEALQALRRAVELDPSDAEARRLLSQAGG